ncbi:GGDEF domain-containing protein [Robertmurraya sp. 2P01SA]|uniref:GGDEF domain-containing protein n=1 Tax=Robertmurraya TaxID=2837507 RepID=UPI0039A51495
MDNFKDLSDTKGHETCDIALKQVTTIMKGETLNYGFSTRYGREEIVALLNSKLINPLVVAEDICSRIESKANVTLSISSQ